jgi:hypothetical protein
MSAGDVAVGEGERGPALMERIYVWEEDEDVT